MDNSRVNEIKKEDKKAFKGFFIVLIISTILGGVFGSTYSNLKEVFGESLSSLVINILEVITPFASLALSILVIIVSTIVYTNSRKGYDLWNQANEDDNSIDRIEKNLSYLMLIISVNQILGFFFMATGGMLLPFDDINGDPSMLKAKCFMIGFILCFVSTILIQKKVINLRKELNPFLKGSIYDMKFSKKWIDSCDESIKMGIYKSSYKSFKCVSTTCLILWLVSIIGYELWDFGIVPMTMVIIIWLVQTVSYCIEEIKSSKVN
ncbi:MAG: DUF3169 family protein [Romboutsia sp.]